MLRSDGESMMIILSIRLSERIVENYVEVGKQTVCSIFGVQKCRYEVQLKLQNFYKKAANKKFGN